MNIFRKYTFVIGFFFAIGINPANAQSIDRSKLVGMDMYSAPDFSKDSSYVINNNWNALNYTENRADAKVSKVQERIPEYLEYMSRNIDCNINTNIFSFNFGGIENFVNYDGKDEDDDGIKEGYDYYKDKIKFGVGAENIPFYEATVTTQEGTPHRLPCFFKGSNDKNVKDNPLDFNQWYFFDYITGNEVRIGDPLMKNDQPVTIQWLGWSPDGRNNWRHGYSTLITFYLNDGVISYTENEIHPNMLKENPHQLKVNMEDDEFYVERGKGEPDLSTSVLGEPEIETNAEYNLPVLTEVESNFTPFDENYPEYGVKEQKFKAEINIGRWNGNNLENLVDSMKRRITIDDAIAPDVVAPKDTIVGYNSNLNLENLGMASTSDDSPYPLEKWYEDNEISNDGKFKVIERTHYAKDVRGNVGSDIQKITIDLDTGIEELRRENKNIDVDVLGNPVSSNSRIRVTSKNYLENGKIFIFNTLGQPIDVIEVNNLMPNEERDIGYSGFGSMKSGTYLMTFTGNGARDIERIVLP